MSVNPQQDRGFDAALVSPVGLDEADCRSPAVVDGTAAQPWRANPPSIVAESTVLESLFRLLVESVQDYAIFMLDADGRVASWNEGAKRIKGYRTDEIIGKHFSCFYTPEDIAAGKPADELAIAVETGRYAEEGRRLRKDGSTFWASVVITALYDQEGQLRGFAKVTQDITSSRQSQEKSRLMVGLALNAMVLVDEAGRIEMVNPQTESLFGYTTGQLIGQPVEMLVPNRFRGDHPANRERYFRNPLERPMGAGRDLYGLRSDGSEFPVEIGLHPIDTDGRRQVLGSIVDISERKAAEAQARKYLDELAHVARLSTAGQMISELAHEMNQPLAAAANYARACVSFARSQQGATVEQLTEWIEKAASQIDRTLQIVNRLSKFVKKESGSVAPVNVNRLIENIVELYVPPVPGGTGLKIRPAIELDESLRPVTADRTQIEQVLLNLIRNGVDAMSDVAPAEVKLVIRTRQAGRFLRIEVSDNGKGIPAEQMSQLFAPFFTTKPGGMGLGLSISRSIVENHGGQMEVESTVGRGSTFSFTLPAALEREMP
jgi:two-component system sensor kinase FixL